MAFSAPGIRQSSPCSAVRRCEVAAERPGAARVQAERWATTKAKRLQCSRFYAIRSSRSPALTCVPLRDTRVAMEMDGKVVVVTGASMGIGEAIAKVFADQGARVVLLSRDATRAEAARQRIGHMERTLAMACDVRQREEIDRALALTLHNFGRVDVWVNNAGVGIRD